MNLFLKMITRVIENPLKADQKVRNKKSHLSNVNIMTRDRKARKLKNCSQSM